MHLFRLHFTCLNGFYKQKNINMHEACRHVKLNFSAFLATCRLGASPECVCLGRETRGDQEDDGDGL